MGIRRRRVTPRSVNKSEKRRALVRAINLSAKTRSRKLGADQRVAGGSTLPLPAVTTLVGLFRASGKSSHLKPQFAQQTALKLRLLCPDNPFGERRRFRDGHAWPWCAAATAHWHVRALQAAGDRINAGHDRTGRWRAVHGAPLEGAPRVVYTASLEVIEDESQDSLRVDINTADIEELDELPEVGPSTAESIIQYRQANGQFSSVDELEEIPGIGPETLEKIAPFATV